MVKKALKIPFIGSICCNTHAAFNMVMKMPLLGGGKITICCVHLILEFCTTMVTFCMIHPFFCLCLFRMFLKIVLLWIYFGCYILLYVYIWHVFMTCKYCKYSVNICIHVPLPTLSILILWRLFYIVLTWKLSDLLTIGVLLWKWLSTILWYSYQVSILQMFYPGNFFKHFGGFVGFLFK